MGATDHDMSVHDDAMEVPLQEESGGEGTGPKDGRSDGDGGRTWRRFVHPSVTHNAIGAATRIFRHYPLRSLIRPLLSLVALPSKINRDPALRKCVVAQVE